MQKPFCASNKMLEQKWRDMAYQRHRDKLKTIKPQIRQQLNKNKEVENYRMQRRIMRVMAEERRHEIIMEENKKLLERIIAIMKSPSPRVDSWNTKYFKKPGVKKRRGLLAKKDPLSDKESEDEDETESSKESESRSDAHSIELPPLE